MKCIAIVPARSGSKGIKDKNIRPVNGKPLIHYTLEAAVESEVFDEVMLSTDSCQYADIARQVKGVSVPFLRDVSNSMDNSSTWDVVREVLNNYKAQGTEFDAFCVLQPTSPLRTSKHIRDAYEQLVNKNADSIISVCKLEHSINTCNILPEDGSMYGFLKDENKYARQMNPTYYRLNGAIYFSKVSSFLEQGTIYTKNSYSYIMDNLSSVDIDEESDLLYVEMLMERK